MTAAEPVVALHDVSKVYRSGSLSVTALADVRLDIDAGEYLAVTGPSGSGKSTLMHILGCLDVATSGSYLLAGEDVGEMSEVDLADVRNRRIGFVFQQFNLLADLTALRNVELPLTYAGATREERRRRALDALDRVGLADRVEHRPGELSGGQQQRVALARALVNRPAVLLLDELHAAGRTIVLITHESDVAAHAQRTVRVLDGRVQPELDGAA